MKNPLIILMLLFSSIVYSQGYKDYIKNRNRNLAVIVTQDAKLAVKEDDAGNKPFTLDITAKMEWRFEAGKIGYPTLILMFERANLYGGDYMAYGLYGGYTFDEVFYLPTKKIIGKDLDLDFTFYSGVASLKRKFKENPSTGWQSFKLSMNVGLEIAVKITDNFGIVNDFKWVSRTDLKYQYPTFNETLSFNYGVGFKYEFL